MDTNTAKNSVRDSAAIWEGHAGVYGSSSNTVVRRFENINPKDVKAAEEYLQQYTSEKNGSVKRLYVTDLSIEKTKLDGKWRGGRVSSDREEDGKYTILQELHEGFVTTTVKKGVVVFSEWITEGGNLWRSGAGATVLRLPNVDPSNVEDIRQELQANETYTNLSCKYETIGGTNHYRDSVPVRDEDGGFHILLFLTKHNNDDFRFVYQANQSERHVHFFKQNMSNTTSNIQAFLDQYYFTPDGDFYISTEGDPGTGAYTNKNGDDTDTGTLPADASLLSGAEIGRTVFDYTPRPNEDRGEISLHLRIVYTVSHTYDGGEDPTSITDPKERLPIITFGEPLERVVFVAKYVGDDLPSDVDVVGQYSDIEIGDTNPLDDEPMTVALSGRKKTVTRLQNADVTGGLFNYDLYRTELTAPINGGDDDWFYAGQDALSERDQQVFYNSVTDDSGAPGWQPGDTGPRIHLISNATKRPKTVNRWRKYFVRQPTSDDLTAAGISTLPENTDPTDVTSYNIGGGGDLFYVEKTQIVLGTVTHDSDAIGNLFNITYELMDLDTPNHLTEGPYITP